MGTKTKKDSKPKEDSTEDGTMEEQQDTSTATTTAESQVDVGTSSVADEASTTSKAVDVEVPVEHKKTFRKRKKHYFNAIRGQMEFYFGDANLSKDRFLKQLIVKDPYVPLETFLSFNKMKALTTRVEDIAKSLSKSELLELDESQTKVKRKTALSENRNVDEKTLYVEALPSSADHEWVRQIFERFGKVSYISLPKYAKSSKIKEFGFIEFDKEESVSKAVKVFKEFNGVLNMQDKDPAELASIKSYVKEQAVDEEDDTVSVTATATATTTMTATAFEDSRKRPKLENDDTESEPKAKKVKIESQVEVETANNECTATQSESETNVDDVKQQDEEMPEDSEMIKRKKRKKKSKSGEKLKQKAELNTDVSYYELKVLPKKDWKRLRNKYLNLQREKVSELKRKAWRERQELKHQCHNIVKEENNAQTPEKDHQNKNPKSSKHKLQKMNMNFYGAASEEEVQPKTPTTEKSQQNPAVERAPLFSYEPGIIVEMAFLEPCVNLKEYKADMRQYPSVKYVDVKEGSMQAHLRLENPDKAKEFVQVISCAEYQCKLLSGEAESMYWQKIERDREQKLNKQVKVPQKRGREKVKKLISKHIRFGDDDE